MIITLWMAPERTKAWRLIMWSIANTHCWTWHPSAAGHRPARVFSFTDRNQNLRCSKRSSKTRANPRAATTPSVRQYCWPIRVHAGRHRSV